MSWPGCLLLSAYQWWCLLLTPQSPPSPSWASAIWRPIEHCQLLSVPRTEVMEKWACSGHQLMCNTFQFQIHSVCYTSPSWNWNWLRINITDRWMLDQLVVKKLHYLTFGDASLILVREGVKKNVFFWDFVPNIGPHPPTAHVWDSSKWKIKVEFVLLFRLFRAFYFFLKKWEIFRTKFHVFI